MLVETANRAAGALLSPDLVDETVREAILASPMPAFLVSQQDGRVLWSSHEAARRLGHADAQAFARAGLPPLAAGAQRVVALARGIAPEAPKRLERLRFNLGFRSVVLTALCEPVALRGGDTALLVAFIEAAPSRNEAFVAEREMASAQPAATPDSPASESGPLPEAPSEAPNSGAPAWVSRGDAERRPIRFVFGLDANGIVERVTPPLADAVGSAQADIVGQPLASVIGAFAPDAAEAIRGAVLAGQTWSGISVKWPVAETDFAIPVDLSALPLMSAEQGLTGFSGFGRCHVDRAERVATPTPTQIPTPIPTELSADIAEVQADAAPPAGSEEAVPGEPSPAFHEPEASADDVARPDEVAARPEEAIALIPEEPAPAPIGETAQNVVNLRKDQPALPHPAGTRNGLSMTERNAFREIARALGAKFDPDQPEESVSAPSPVVAEAPAAPATEDTMPLFDSAPPPPVESAPAPEAAPATAMDRGLLDRLPMGLLVMRDGEVLFANRTLLDLAGYADLAEFRAEDGANAIFRKSAPPRERESGFDTLVLTARDGEMMPVDAHLQLVDWDGGRAQLMSLRRASELEQGKALRSVALDLKRVRSEAAELRAVLDTATDGVATLDEKGRILSLNGAAEALFGLDQREVAGEHFQVLLHPDSHAEIRDYFDGLAANGVKSVLNDGREVQGREKKGGRIPLFMTLGRISDDEPRRYCAVLRDLTAWKRAEGELTDARRTAEMASARKSDFLAKISHEIRTPMNAIIGFAEVMMEERLGPVGNAKYKEYLGDIRTSGKHVVSLVNDLLDLSKIEAGRMEMSFAATDLNAIVASSVGIIQPQANANRVLVRTQLQQKLPPVVADERSIRQIILNMLSNATRFTEAGGQVIVATALLETGEAVIRIRDTGVGMTASEIEQALEPFRQVGTRRVHGGTGLGLPLTKALVEANRASFAIRSTPGEGTMVEITFPSTRVLAE